MANKELVYFKRNVGYTVVVRRNIMDSQGYSLNNQNDWIGVEVDDVRDFKMANKRVIMEGLVISADAPVIDWETPNALTDEDITELLKNYMKLKNTLQTLDSIATLSRLLDAARDQDKSLKIKNLIKDRLEELGEEVLSEEVLKNYT